MTNGPKFPEVGVQLSGEDGNAFYILGKVQRAMRRKGIPKIEIDKYIAEATAGDYDHLLQTTIKYVTVDPDE